MKGLKDKIVLVTGGAKGLGKAMTTRFLQEGGTVVIADVDLTPQGWELALRLTTRWPGVVLWPVSALEEYICQVRN